MSGPATSVAAVRHRVRDCLADLASGTLVLVGCSGGADSVALAAATAFEARRGRWRAGLVSVDHGLQPGSAARAERVADWGRAQGFSPSESVTVRVASAGGPEAAARDARYAALDAAADRHGAAVLLLAHTRDDQAETVLLGLARGSGARSLAGMPARRGRYRRPLLDLPRPLVRDAAGQADIEIWDDPHNVDPAYARSAVRAALRDLASLLDRDLSVNLARTARLLRADADALDAIAAQRRAEAVTADGLDVAALAAMPAAIRVRVLRDAVVAILPGMALRQAHLDALDALVTGWHGQGPVALPRGVCGSRRHGRLLLQRGGSDG